MADQVLDAKGLNCPLPILKTKKAIKGMTPGQVLQVMATDPGSIADMTAFCNQTGNELMSQSNEGDVYTFEIKVA
ncbi:sulfurtransferase TusA family protein [Sinisalibacter aestuarii]|uniref:Response regulator SirA n=1 Tax=Sinisalibacter aestuarii TaxID=2949426 RepID=A0ABQ5LQ39_9RHOB|nr:sulfurtransferase TusA family protein [Sinisalibacter aestuarii]GKY86391.1 response regulator SirA [Sinisalibacter aestuarii]